MGQAFRLEKLLPIENEPGFALIGLPWIHPKSRAI